MANLNLQYYCGTDLYSDGDVENEILEIVEKGNTLSDVSGEKFSILYHLSPIRENIINWYPFKKNASILEIGSGCGAITGILCQKLQKVVSVDLSKRRAQVNYTRHKEFSNLDIYVGNFNEMQFETLFDYIILNGVFEYAMSFTEGPHPYETFLQNIKRFLKPDGVILIAIENRLGLKYFAGAPEDHTDKYFDGLSGYQGNTSVRTFSKAEWQEIMQRCGLTQYRFYYPYPDYKFPKEIFTDESLNSQKYGRPTWNFTPCRVELFPEEQVAESLQREGVMSQFANSFLIEMSGEELPKDRVVTYAKLGTDRAERFSIATTVEERREEDGSLRRVVRKEGMSPEARTHIQRMLEKAKSYTSLIKSQESWRPLPGEIESSAALYPFLTGKSLGQKAEKIIAQQDKDGLHSLIEKVAEHCTGAASVGEIITAAQMTEDQKKQFAEVFGAPLPLDGERCISPANIDLILDNIFEEEKETWIIDCEWIFDFPVPISFLLWRTINELYANYPELEAWYHKEAFLKQFDIDAEASQRCWLWATHFAEKYVGANQMFAAHEPLHPLSLESYRLQKLAVQKTVCQLFVDTGKGYNEEEKIMGAAVLDENGEFSVSFDLTAYPTRKALRFDPIEGSPCICRIDHSDNNTAFRPVNAARLSKQTGEGDLFLTTDPIYESRQAAGADTLTLHGKLRPLSFEEALARADQIIKKSQKFTFWR